MLNSDECKLGMLVMMVKVIFRIVPPVSVSLDIESITDRKMAFETQVLLIMRHFRTPVCSTHSLLYS